MKSLRYLAEYISLRLVAGLVDILPYRASLFIGWLNALFIFHVCHYRVKIAKQRIRQVFGDKYSRHEINRIAWQSYRNIIFSAIEMIRLHKMTLEWIGSYTDFLPTIEIIKKHSSTGRGSIITVPHTGSWEMAAVACQLVGVPVFSIAARQKNPLTDAYLNKLRTSTGLETIARGSGIMRDILRNLSAGKALAILPDVRMPHEAISVPFLGGIANIGGGMANFARHADVPIFPCIVTRKGWAQHVGVMYEPIWPDKNLSKEDDIRRMTLIVMKHVEDTIRQDPGQWFWFNKRWILDPVEPKNPEPDTQSAKSISD
ncbi:MAG: lysophospholipid acyltransferase family protein [Kiritimatiellae bacterium]|nr:lysophospholipid acyltransferase family protein [Kiritimatiellia bacterium]